MSNMETENEVVCGADIHRDFLVATTVSRSGLKLQERFDMNQDGLLTFKSWILDHRCQRVAVESTGSYWYQIFYILEGHVEFVLANAYQVRNIDGKKTDRLDSQDLLFGLNMILVMTLNRIIQQNPAEALIAE
jgi:transposase